MFQGTRTKHRIREGIVTNLVAQHSSAIDSVQCLHCVCVPLKLNLEHATHGPSEQMSELGRILQNGRLPICLIYDSLNQEGSEAAKINKDTSAIRRTPTFQFWTQRLQVISTLEDVESLHAAIHDKAWCSSSRKASSTAPTKRNLRLAQAKRIQSETNI